MSLTSTMAKPSSFTFCSHAVSSEALSEQTHAGLPTTMSCKIRLKESYHLEEAGLLC